MLNFELQKINEPREYGSLHAFKEITKVQHLVSYTRSNMATFTYIFLFCHNYCKNQDTMTKKKFPYSNLVKEFTLEKFTYSYVLFYYCMVIIIVVLFQPTATFAPLVSTHSIPYHLSSITIYSLYVKDSHTIRCLCTYDGLNKILQFLEAFIMYILIF